MIKGSEKRVRYNGILYAKQNAKKSFEILSQSLNKADNNLPIWLMRESNANGIIAIDYMSANKKGTLYIALDKSKRWLDVTKDINEKRKIKSVIPMTQDNIAQYSLSLSDFIANNFTNLFVNEYFVKSKNPSDIVNAITSEFDGEVFREPVVLIKDIEIKNVFIKLSKGKTYEKSALVELGIKDEAYYENIALKNVIEQLKSMEISKIESLEKDCLEDVVQLEVFIHPKIIPSGHSYSSRTIKELAESQKMICPLSDKPFNDKSAIENKNLALFVMAWMKSKDKFIEKKKAQEKQKQINEQEKDPGKNNDFDFNKKLTNTFQPQFEHEIIKKQLLIEKEIEERKNQEAADLQLALRLQKSL